MAKAKSKKKGLSDRKNEAAVKKNKPMNPFEIHVNRQKFQVLGRKLKTDRGLPGLARAKAIKKRKETLLQEYKVFGKSNKFVDRRIGEFNKDMTAEDKIMARFAAERASSHKKKAMFNLADDEALTHKGRSIMELETFEDPPSDDDDLFDKKLDGRFTEEAHFGGGMLKKSEGSRMAVIDQLIADSKKRKAEKAAAKEQTLAATEKLDSEWRDLLPVLANSKFGEEENFKKDDYDKILGSLRFEARGTPSDRLKSEAEVAEQEAKRLRELEEDRLRRMNGEMNSKANSKPKHRSADDLDDGFELDDDDKDDFVVAYDEDGNLINAPDDAPKTKSTDSEAGVESDEGDSGDEDGSDGDEDESDDEYDDLKLFIDGSDEDGGDENDDDDGEQEAEEREKETTSKEAKATKRKRNSESECDEMDAAESPSKEKKLKKGEKNNETVVPESSSKQKKKNKGDKSDDTDISESPSKEKKKKKKDTTDEDTQDGDVVDEKSKAEQDPPSKKKVSFKTGVDMVSYSTEEEPKSVEQLEEMRKDSEKQAAAGRENEKQMATARSELPYTFIVPNECDEFEELMKDRTLVQQAVIIERMIKCTHPSLKEGNRQKLEVLFTFVLQRLNDAEYDDTWTTLDAFAPYLFDLAQFSPGHAAEALNQVLSEKFSDHAKKKKNHYPYPDTLVFLKLVPLLFPTSDKKHQVTTPAFVFISSLLHTCRPNTRRGIATGLFLCALLTQYVSLSKRIVPEAITYLNGVIGMATLQVSKDKSKSVPPFLPEYKFLCVNADLSKFGGSCKMSLLDLGRKGTPVDDEFRVKAMFSALTSLETFISFYSDKPGAFLLFEPVAHTLEAFKAVVSQILVNVEDEATAPSVSVLGKKQFLNRYPPLVARKMEDVIAALETLKKKPLPPLVKKAAPPFLLRLKEPNIRPVFDKNKDKDEKIRLKRRIKKEAKGVLREIRKDRSFLAGVRYKERKASDVERMRKVKEIYSWGAQQQGELNKMDRIKKRKFRR